MIDIMTKTTFSASTFADSKPHYEILDGLRGVAALLVIFYHVFECFDWSPAPHGYLAVDFFFVLSGFVIGYAYDDRWKSTDKHKSLTIRGFFRHRLIRLHPMVLLGSAFGVVCFLLQGGVRWDGTPVSVGWVMLALLLNMLMLPVLPNAGADVRGNGEMFPLNGPHWSLFFEYIGNILYALLLRRLPTKILAVIAVASGAMLASIALREGHLGIGWSLLENGFWVGLVRMLFPYSIGLLMARIFKPLNVKNAFWICSGVIGLVGCLPLVFGELQPWQNGLYDALCVIVVFPALVWLGASELHVGRKTAQVSRFLGDLSYSLYAIHYPLMYLFFAGIDISNGPVPIAKFGEVWPVAIAVVLDCLLLAWISFRFYDLPVRRWLDARKRLA